MRQHHDTRGERDHPRRFDPAAVKAVVRAMAAEGIADCRPSEIVARLQRTLKCSRATGFRLVTRALAAGLVSSTEW